VGHHANPNLCVCAEPRVSAVGGVGGHQFNDCPNDSPVSPIIFFYRKIYILTQLVIYKEINIVGNISIESDRLW